MRTLTEISEDLFWQEPAKSYAKILANDDWLFRNPYSDGLIAAKYKPLDALARHPDMQAVNRQQRGAIRAADGPTSRMLIEHPHFLNEPRHAPLRRQAFKMLNGPGVAALSELVMQVANAKSATLTDRQNDLVEQYTKQIAAEVWSILLTGEPSHGAFLAKNSRPIGKLMAFETTKSDIVAADRGSQALLAWAIDLGTLDGPEMAAAMSFDAIDGAAGMASNAIWLLLERPDLWAELALDRALIGPFVQEAIRLVPSVLGLDRSPVKTLVVNDRQITAGTNVLFLNSVGNRDPEIFRSPNQIDLHRNAPKALSFGAGPRACAGRTLARLAAEASITALIDRYAQIELVEDVDWGPPGQLRTPKSLMCRMVVRK